MNKGKHQSYWKNKLAGNIPELTIPTDHERPEVLSGEGKTYSYRLDDELSKKVNAWCNEQNISTYSFVLACVNMLLHRYSNENIIIVGSPNAGRNHPDLENQIGFYVNTLVLRNHVEGDHSFLQTVKQCHKTSVEALEHQDYPYDKLVEDLNIERKSNRNPLFDVMVSMQNLSSESKDQATKMEDLSIETETATLNVSKFDLTFVFARDEEGTLEGGIEYSTDLFEETSIIRMKEVLERIMDQGLENPEIKVAQIELVEEAETSDPEAGFDEEDTMVDFDF